jgi:nucleoside-diphosphate-sugar epimerase
VPALIHALLQGRTFAASAGTQVRDYLHVDDVASGFVRLALARASGIYNISSGTPITVQELMRTVGRILGKEDLIHFGKAEPRSWDPPHLCGDSSRLRSLGWGPQYDLERGLNDAIDYCRSTEAQGA